MEWLPIETAPTGKALLLYYPPIKTSRNNDGGLGEWIAVGYFGQTVRLPTYWMPLPQPPKAQS